MPLLREHSKDVIAGRFAFGGDEHARWASTVEGITATTSVLFGVDDDTAMSMSLELGEEVCHVILTTILDSLPPSVVAKIQATMKEQEQTMQTQQEDTHPNG